MTIKNLCSVSDIRKINLITYYAPFIPNKNDPTEYFEALYQSLNS